MLMVLLLMAEIRRETSWGEGSLSHYLQGYIYIYNIYISGGWTNPFETYA